MSSPDSGGNCMWAAEGWNFTIICTTVNLLSLPSLLTYFMERRQIFILGSFSITGLRHVKTSFSSRFKKRLDCFLPVFSMCDGIYTKVARAAYLTRVRTARHPWGLFSITSPKFKVKKRVQGFWHRIKAFVTLQPNIKLRFSYLAVWKFSLNIFFVILLGY